MDCQDYITELVERKKGQHLQREERGAIQHLKNAGYTNRAIARAIGCSPTTVWNELKRGTPPRKSSKGRKPGYSARRGEAAYKARVYSSNSQRTQTADLFTLRCAIFPCNTSVFLRKNVLLNAKIPRCRSHWELEEYTLENSARSAIRVPSVSFLHTFFWLVRKKYAAGGTLFAAQRKRG